MSWTSKRLHRTVRRPAGEKIVEPELLDPAPRKPAADSLVVLVAGIASRRAGPQAAADRQSLEALRERPPRGGTRWHASSVRHLLQRAERLGLLGTPLPFPRTSCVVESAASSGRPAPETAAEPVWRPMRRKLQRKIEARPSPSPKGSDRRRAGNRHEGYDNHSRGVRKGGGSAPTVRSSEKATRFSSTTDLGELGEAGHIGGQGVPMAGKALSVPPSPAAAARPGKSVEATALLALRPLSAGELARVSRALAAEGIADLHTTSVRLTARDARAVSHGERDPFSATIVPGDPSALASNQNNVLAQALDAARARGAMLQEELLADSEMLTTAGMAARLGMSEEGIRLKRKRHEILGLEFAKRGIRYPSWQLLPDRQLLPALPRLFAMLGDDSWRLFRFLQQHHSELGGERAVEALRRGRIEAVLAAAENAASGAFA